ncbi:hypothetical protein OUY22_24535 [Nonomuraea sp. MCN248]|uniref:Uncharacterized protein n=1 Tax=Nonomuraea corallina TaxID=2989783 RepID=A0ABT4SHA5_9ACTN|nr:hypothetical protein [Nonomuraea corallina]MDA0636594.1 hypothetical protein [Nonomuraea corallina]
MTGRHVVRVETLMLRASADGSWAYRRAEVRPEPGESPDEAARRSCGVSAGDQLTVVHSTSWRHLPDGEIVLTYAVCPDPEPWLPAVTLPRLEPARGAAPARPAPERVEVDHVAAHAVRHLAFLLAEDPIVRRTLLRHPALAPALENWVASGRSGAPAPA